MIDKISAQVGVSVDRATKRAADALEKVTNRLTGETGSGVDKWISVRLTSQYSENYQKAGNAQDSISYLQTRDGALESAGGMLQQLRDLAVKMGDPILSSSDKALIMKQAGSIMSDLDSVGSSVKFNEHNVADDVSLDSLGLSDMQFGADGTIDAIDSAIQQVSSKRAETGANINTLKARINSLSNASINIAKTMDSHSGDIISDVINLTQAVRQAVTTYKAADIVLDLNKEKVKSLLDMM